MPRRLRYAPGGLVYHVLNRAVARARIFDKSMDYAAFEKVLKQAKDQVPMRVLAYCCMPNHWHLILWPFHDGDLSTFLHGLSMTHTQRWHVHQRSVGTGPLDQGRFKSFPIQEDGPLWIACRYVERNPLRANLVSKSATWRWGSLWHRVHGTGERILDALPLPFPDKWEQHVDEPQSETELAALQKSIARGCPFGQVSWRIATAARLGLQSTLRPLGRPRKCPVD